MGETRATENETTAKGADRGYTITRMYDAPRELVWKALTEPDQFANWFGEPGTRWENLTMDVRPGGSWSGTMIVPDGREIPWAGSYLEVVEPERLVIAVADQVVLGEEYEAMTITLTGQGGKTELVLSQSGGHLSDEQYEQAREGTSTFLDRIAELVERR